MLTTSLGMLKRLYFQKSPEAWESFVGLYGPLIYKWNVRAGISKEDAKDISQEVLLEVFRKVQTFDRRRSGSFRAWLNRINYFKMMNFKKARGRELECKPGHHELNHLGELVSNISWAEDYYQDVFNRALAIIESECSHRDWVIFQKSFVDQLPPDLIARQLKCSKKAVYIVHCRTLKKLKVVVLKFIEDLN
jgi:RNA polymerase sigma-70 factor (ECF subfamily)